MGTNIPLYTVSILHPTVGAGIPLTSTLVDTYILVHLNVDTGEPVTSTGIGEYLLNTGVFAYKTFTSTL